MRLTAAEWKLAQHVCTPKQLEALDYWRHGYGYKRIGTIMEIGRDNARGYVDRALSNIKRSLATSDR